MYWSKAERRRAVELVKQVFPLADIRCSATGGMSIEFPPGVYSQAEREAGLRRLRPTMAGKVRFS